MSIFSNESFVFYSHSAIPSKHKGKAIDFGLLHRIGDGHPPLALNESPKNDISTIIFIQVS